MIKPELQTIKGKFFSACHTFASLTMFPTIWLKIYKTTTKASQTNLSSQVTGQRYVKDCSNEKNRKSCRETLKYIFNYVDGAVFHIFSASQISLTTGVFELWTFLQYLTHWAITQSAITCSKLTIKTPEEGAEYVQINNKDTRTTPMRCYSVLIVNFEHIPHLVLKFLLLNLGR